MKTGLGGHSIQLTAPTAGVCRIVSVQWAGKNCIPATSTDIIYTLIWPDDLTPVLTSAACHAAVAISVLPLCSQSVDKVSMFLGCFFCFFFNLSWSEFSRPREEENVERVRGRRRRNRNEEWQLHSSPQQQQQVLSEFWQWCWIPFSCTFYSPKVCHCLSEKKKNMFNTVMDGLGKKIQHIKIHFYSSS